MSASLDNLFGNFGFGQPAWLLLLLLLIPLLRRWTKPAPAVAVTYSSLKLLAGLARPHRAAHGRWLVALRTAILVLLVLALARPRMEKAADADKSKGIDIMLVVDCSESMDSRDFDFGSGKVSRMEALRHVLGVFIQDRPRDRLGIIGFSEKPFLISPLTLDHSWMMEALTGIKTALGTAIGSGLESGVDLLAKNGGGTKVVILVTDGLNTSGTDPLEAAALARRFGVRLYTIGLVTYDDMQTKNLDAITLYRMARTTGGQFFQAANTDGLQSIYEQIDRLEKSELKQPRLRDYRELFAWFAGAALGLLALEWTLNHTRGMRLP